MIDAHFHAWQLARGDYAWLTPDLRPIYRDVHVADWTVHAKQHQINGGILVQAAPSFEETQFLLEEARRNPMVRGVVGWIDMLAPNALDKVKQCAAEPLLKGLRPMLQDIPDPDWILQAQVQPVLHAMAEHGLVLDALIQPIHISRILIVTQRHPNLSVVIDHGAKPVIEPDALAAWQNQMRQLAQTTPAQRVMCKLSGLWTEAPAGSPVSSIRVWAEALIDIWTPARLIWASDWPVLEMAGSYSEWRTFALQVIAKQSAPLQAQILGENARRIYRLHD